MGERKPAGAQDARPNEPTAGPYGEAADRLFRLAVEAAPSAMVMVDAIGRIVMVNSQAEHSFGYNRAEMLGRSVDMLVPERARIASRACP